MTGTIEELEREIDLFKQNIVSSNEMVDLLQNILNQIKAQNQLFDSQSNELMSKMEGIPEILEKANTDSNNIIQKDISKEIKKDEYKYFSWLIEQAHKRNALIHGLGFTNLEGLTKYHFDTVTKFQV